MAAEDQELDLHDTADNATKQVNKEQGSSILLLSISYAIQILEEKNSPDHADAFDQTTKSKLKNHKKLFRVIVYMVFIFVGQTSATLFGRVYYDNGGKSIWLATLRQTVAFPILIPFLLYVSPTKNSSIQNNHTNSPSLSTLAAAYVSLGVFLALDNMLYSIGLLHLPVSTFSLICATQLAFNVIFSVLFNAQQLTPPIINSVFVLTISSVLLVLQTGSENSKNISNKKQIIGILSTVLASALFSLLLSLTQLFFQKVLRRQSLRAALKMIIYQPFIASCIGVVALFVSKEGGGLKREMGDFESGKVSYVMISVGISVAWQVFTIGTTGLIFEVSSLFSNVIGTLGLPIVPILAVRFFHDKMNGAKIISLILALWGFASYIYEQYLHRNRSHTDTENVSKVSEIGMSM